MEWINLSIWIVFIFLILNGDTKSFFRGVFVFVILIIQSTDKVQSNFKELDLILISIVISIIGMYLMSKGRLHEKGK